MKPEINKQDIINVAEQQVEEIYIKYNIPLNERVVKYSNYKNKRAKTTLKLSIAFLLVLFWLLTLILTAIIQTPVLWVTGKDLFNPLVDWLIYRISKIIKL